MAVSYFAETPIEDPQKTERVVIDGKEQIRCIAGDDLPRLDGALDYDQRAAADRVAKWPTFKRGWT